MLSKREPFNIFLLSNQKSRLMGLLPVQSMDIKNIGGEFHPQGLYSIEIFGALGSRQRQNKHAYIDMRCYVMHPKVFSDLEKLKGLYAGIMSRKQYAVWDANLKDFVKSDAIDGKTGYSFFMSHFEDIQFQRNESGIRDARIDLLIQEQKKCMYRYLVVIPAGLRDLTYDEKGQEVEDEINPIYRKILRTANTILADNNNINPSNIDVARWTLQSSFNELYDYIESILSGKRGLILSKLAARAVHGGTRAVLTAADPSPALLNAPGGFTVNDTLVGLHQYIKGTVELTIYGIKTGLAKDIIDRLPGEISLVNKSTLTKITLNPSTDTVTLWGGEVGLEKLINKFEKPIIRHNPIMIDGHYLALLYRDSKHFKVLYDISDLPKEFNKANVKPITWAEFFYLAVYEKVKDVAVYVTRYPITELGSIYPSMVKLQTTVQCEKLIPLDDDWKPITTNLSEVTAYAMPVLGKPFYDSISVHTTKIAELNADYDGDKVNAVFVLSKEAVDEVKKYHHTKTTFLNSSGSLRYGAKDSLIGFILHGLTSGLDKDKIITIEPLKESETKNYIQLVEHKSHDPSLGGIVIDKLKVESIYSNLSDSANIGYTLKRGSAIVGFAVFIRSGVSMSGELYCIVLDIYSGNNYGYKILKTLLKQLKTLGVNEVITTIGKDAAAGIVLCKKLGFMYAPIRSNNVIEYRLRLL